MLNLIQTSATLFVDSFVGLSLMAQVAWVAGIAFFALPPLALAICNPLLKVKSLPGTVTVNRQPAKRPQRVNSESKSPIWTPSQDKGLAVAGA